MQDPAPSGPGVVLAPRPIPDPVPLDEPAPPWLWLLLTAAAIAVIGLVVRRRLSRGKSAPEPAGTVAPPEAVPTPEIVDTSCVEGAAQQVRIWLAERMGETWLARTTESILQDGVLREGLDANVRHGLGDLLLEADRVKFSPRGGAGGTRWTAKQLTVRLELLHAALVPAVPSTAPIRSTTTKSD